jgi:hypothetical protein
VTPTTDEEGDTDKERSMDILARRDNKVAPTKREAELYQ